MLEPIRLQEAHMSVCTEMLVSVRREEETMSIVKL